MKFNDDWLIIPSQKEIGKVPTIYLFTPFPALKASNVRGSGSKFVTLREVTILGLGLSHCVAFFISSSALKLPL